MNVFQKPVYNNTDQSLTYTFLDQNGSVIDLTTYTSAVLEIKVQGQVYSITPATILTPATNGQVQCTSVLFSEVGVWDAQFYAVAAGGNKVFGAPLQITVVPNVEDLTINQLQNY